ncbi:hypothetical protein TNCV_4131541 [Trichonephila clavipes]|nr:hypothetical protein TNCV_4131541 [Trichonephila clavipes]
MHRRSGTEELLLWWEVKPNATPSATLPKNKGRSMTPPLARDLTVVSGRISKQSRQTCRDSPLHPKSSLLRLFDCIQQERLDILQLKTPVVEITKLEACSFQL